MGVFSASTLEWGSRTTNVRGFVLLKVFSELDVVLANVGPLYTSGGRRLGSIVDLIYVGVAIATLLGKSARTIFIVTTKQSICNRQRIELEKEF